MSLTSFSLLVKEFCFGFLGFSSGSFDLNVSCSWRFSNLICGIFVVLFTGATILYVYGVSIEVPGSSCIADFVGWACLSSLSTVPHSKYELTGHGQWKDKVPPPMPNTNLLQNKVKIRRYQLTDLFPSESVSVEKKVKIVNDENVKTNISKSGVQPNRISHGINNTIYNIYGEPIQIDIHGHPMASKIIAEDVNNTVFSIYGDPIHNINMTFQDQWIG